MIGNDFIYNNIRLSDFDMVMMPPEEAQQFVPRNVERAEITSLRARPNHYGTTYNDVLVLNFFIMKKDAVCGDKDQEAAKLTDEEIHHLRAAFESAKFPRQLTVEKDDSNLTTHYDGIFTDVQPYIIGQECYGLYMTFTCNSPYGYYDEQMTYKINASSATLSTLYINTSAEREEYLRPVITITSQSKFGDNETITFVNTSDNNYRMSIKLPAGKKKITIDCEKRIVTDENGTLLPLASIGASLPVVDNYNFISTDSFMFYWLGFLYGENRIRIIPSQTNTIKNVVLGVKTILKTGGF